MNNSILSCRQLAKSYSDGKSVIHVLRSVDLDVAPGEMVAVVGSSGSGKSTLLHLLAGLDKPTSGEVLLNGKSIVSIREKEISAFRRDNLGFVFQSYNLMNSMTALENVAIPMELAGAPY